MDNSRTFIKINTDEIPEYKRLALAKTVIDLTNEYFSKPGVEEDFQKWLVKRNEQKSKNSRNGK